MDEYHVSYMVVYSRTVEAESPEEAAEAVAADCPYDVDYPAAVTNCRTGEYCEVY